MAAMTMDSSAFWTMPNFVDSLYDTPYENIRSDELNRLIDEDVQAAEPLDQKDFFISEDSRFIKWHPAEEYDECPSQGISKECESSVEHLDEPDFVPGWFCYPRFLDQVPDAFKVMVNPRTGSLVTHPFSHTELPDKQSPKPYHPSQEHDYSKMPVEDDVLTHSTYEELFKTEEEVVEVWEIDNFTKVPPVVDPVPQQATSVRQKLKEPRRTSTRTAEIRRREQARVISNAVHAVVLKNDKGQRTRQYKCIKPKNSVETTPSQSDIEEWYSQPARQTHTKVTKKKTSKGRIDHSESERHRREILRKNFSSLSDLIPNKYLLGEKASSQISKQKILNGAKAFIEAIHTKGGSYKSLFNNNRLLKEKWQKLIKCSVKLLKCSAKQK